MMEFTVVEKSSSLLILISWKNGAESSIDLFRSTFSTSFETDFLCGDDGIISAELTCALLHSS